MSLGCLFVFDDVMMTIIRREMFSSTDIQNLYYGTGVLPNTREKE